MEIGKLFICVTPLQMLIAKSIIKSVITEEEKRSYDVIVVTYDDNEKYRYYAKMLKKEANSFIYFHVKNDSKLSRFFDIISFKKVVKKCTHVRYENIYVASVDNPFIQYCISNFSFLNIRTFDDGIANIMKESIYYQNLKHGFFESLIKKMLGIRVNKDYIVENSEIHYTLYPSFDNIVEKKVNLKLVSNESCVGDIFLYPKEKEISIFLGQPIVGFFPLFTSDYYLRSIEKTGAEYYYPHPRERVRISGIKYIESSLIFEDYILNLIEYNKYSKIRIYTFFSTALFNLYSSVSSNVEFIVLKDQFLDNDFSSFYELCDKINVKYLNI